MSYRHQPVLLKTVIEHLAIQADGTYMDLTFGRGGHSREILKLIGPEGRLIAVDKDTAAVKEGKTKSFLDPRFSIYHSSFSELDKIVTSLGLSRKVNGILMDLGVSSPQLDDPERGFSFIKEGPLDMRMNPEQNIDASYWLNQSEKKDIFRALVEYAEERYASRIATAIVNERKKKPILKTQQLVKLVERVVPTRDRRKHPATRVFQAIRIAVNSELKELKQCLEKCVQVLSVGGRMAVISFHSVEDRIVKRFFQKESKGDDFPPELPILAIHTKHRFKCIGGLIRPTDDEIKRNRRSRSARLRIVERLP